MQWYNDVPKPTNTEVLGQFKATRFLPKWSWAVVLTSLALATLACGLFNPTSRPSSSRIIIRTNLPTLTPTAIALPQAGPISEEPTVVSSVPLATPIPPPTFTPAGADIVASSVTTDPSGNGPPLLTTLVVLNVRTGPGVEYVVLGQLNQGQSTEVIGRNPEGTWWQVVYPLDSNESAWVSADIQYSTVSNVEGVPIAQVPVLPTATTTPTSVPTVQPTEPPESISTSTVPPPVMPTTPPQARATLPIPTGVRPSVE